ncbi:FimV/HubP family polar landmark protein [Lysobacter gummosus]|uniref:FimV/HubP family polar landmark protein n=1 Tax=Lysobacter gummosus TaxID=262324 RepID=UPI003630757A
MRFVGKAGRLRPTFDIRYLHDLSNDAPRTQNHFAAAQVPGFAITGFSPDRNRINAGAGLTYAFTPSATGFVEYRADLSSDDQAHSVQAGVRFTFGGTTQMAAVSAAPWAPAQADTATAAPAAVAPVAAASSGGGSSAALPVVAAAAAAAPAAAAVAEPRSPAPSGGGTCKAPSQGQPMLDDCSRYSTVPGDSVTGIANRMTTGVLEQRMVALYRGNTAAFNGNNMNRLKAHSDIGIPCADAVKDIPVSEAKRVVGQHARSHVERHGPFKPGATGPASEQPMQCGE